MTIILKEKFVLLCEGAADKAFFEKLIEKRRLPRFDIPFPAKTEPGIAGKDAWDRMLIALRGDPKGFGQIRGILIVTDSGDIPANTFVGVQRLIRRAGGYNVPDRLLVPSNRDANSPPIAVMLLPNERTAGSLESLCLRAFVASRRWVYPCIDQYLGCAQIEALNWGAEKLAKAKFHSAVAALYKHDPSRALSWAFRESNKTPRRPMISAKSPSFDSVERRLRHFHQQVR